MCLGSTDYRVRHTCENCGAQDGMARSGIPPDLCHKYHPDTASASRPTCTHCHTLDIHAPVHRDHCRMSRVGSALSWLVKWLNIQPNTIQSPPKAATSKFGYALSGSLHPLTLHTESRLPNIRHSQPSKAVSSALLFVIGRTTAETRKIPLIPPDVETGSLSGLAEIRFQKYSSP